MTPKGRELVVVGAGPAGMAAALAAAAAGMTVTLVDEAPTAGGQYFRGRQNDVDEGSPRDFQNRATGVTVLLGTAVIDVPDDGRLTLWDAASGCRSIAYDRLVLATGAYDRAVAIPGWTLPGVLAAGGASTLAKLHGVAAGRRILVAGSGPFLLAATDDLSAIGCSVEIVEATPLGVSIRGLAHVVRDPAIARQTMRYLAHFATRGVRRSYGEMVTRILGTNRVEGAVINRVDADWSPIPGTERNVAVDGVCLGFGFVPQLDLAQALGCRLDYDADAANHFVAVDDAMRTSRPEIYAAGELTGIGGMQVAKAKGHLAGLAAAYDAGALSSEAFSAGSAPVRSRLRAMCGLADWIARAFRPRPGLWRLADAATTLCRCEDVRCGDAERVLAVNAASPFSVKTMTRAGMGLCQGRVCGPYLAEWLRARHGYIMPAGERPWRIRPPLRPVPLADWPES